MEDGETDTKSTEAGESGEPKKVERRKIPGNFSYTTSPGVFRKVLEGIITAERPQTFSRDFLKTVLNLSGGSAWATIPILKASGFLNADSTPTEIYSRFQTEAGRANAALEALKKGYSEVFRKNQYAQKLDDAGLKDVLIEITGLKKSDNIIQSIAGTMRPLMDYAKSATQEKSVEPTGGNDSLPVQTNGGNSPDIGLVYNINIVLPETTNIEVYNTIFKSLKANLIR